MDRIYRSVEFDKALFGIVANADAPHALPSRWVARGIDEGVVEVVRRKSYGRDPYAMSLEVASDSLTFIDSDAIPSTLKLSSAFYHDVYENTGTCYGMRSFYAVDRRPLGFLLLLRSERKGDFSRRDERIMTQLAPHIAQKLGALLDDEKSGRAFTGSPSNDALFQKLTQRERAVASLVVAGLSDDEVAGKLFISKATFKKHLGNIYRKAGTSNRVQLIRMLNGASR